MKSEVYKHKSAVWYGEKPPVYIGPVYRTVSHNAKRWKHHNNQSHQQQKVFTVFISYFKCVDFEYWQFHIKLMANRKIAPQAKTLLHKQLRGEHLWNYPKNVDIINKAALIRTKTHSVSEDMKRQQSVKLPQTPRRLSGSMDVYCGRTSEILVSTGSRSHTGWFTVTSVVRWVSPVPVWALQNSCEHDGWE